MVLCLCQAMESKLLVGGKNITDHTNEQQKMLEMKRQEIAEQVKFNEMTKRNDVVNLLTTGCPSPPRRLGSSPRHGRTFADNDP